jgi:hypothetical protein
VARKEKVGAKQGDVVSFYEPFIDKITGEV